MTFYISRNVSRIKTSPAERSSRTASLERISLDRQALDRFAGVTDLYPGSTSYHTIFKFWVHFIIIHWAQRCETLDTDWPVSDLRRALKASGWLHDDFKNSGIKLPRSKFSVWNYILNILAQADYVSKKAALSNWLDGVTSAIFGLMCGYGINVTQFHTWCKLPWGVRHKWSCGSVSLTYCVSTLSTW